MESKGKANLVRVVIVLISFLSIVKATPVPLASPHIFSSSHDYYDIDYERNSSPENEGRPLESKWSDFVYPIQESRDHPAIRNLYHPRPKLFFEHHDAHVMHHEQVASSNLHPIPQYHSAAISPYIYPHQLHHVHPIHLYRNPVQVNPSHNPSYHTSSSLRNVHKSPSYQKAGNLNNHGVKASPFEAVPAKVTEIQLDLARTRNVSSMEDQPAIFMNGIKLEFKVVPAQAPTSVKTMQELSDMVQKTNKAVPRNMTTIPTSTTTTTTTPAYVELNEKEDLEPISEAPPMSAGDEMTEEGMTTMSPETMMDGMSMENMTDIRNAQMMTSTRVPEFQDGQSSQMMKVEPQLMNEFDYMEEFSGLPIPPVMRSPVEFYDDSPMDNEGLPLRSSHVVPSKAIFHGSYLSYE